MKSLIQILFYVLLMTTSISIKAQTLIVDYKYSMGSPNQTENAQMPSVVTKALEGFSNSFIFKLIHCKGKSSAKRIEITDGQAKKVNFQGKSHEIYKDFLGQNFYIANTKLENTVVKGEIKGFYNWVLSEETITIKGYKCKKATTQEGDKTITAWFTEDIAITDGPSRYFGLPGLILKLQTTMATFEAQNIIFEKTDTVIIMPTAPNNINYAEYAKQQLASTKKKP
jgi:GLPGLI family protein